MEDSEKLCERLAAEYDTALCSFSMGKDSIASFLQMRKYFKRVELVFKYPIPGLEFQERALAYYEDKFGQRIKRMPHPSLYRQLASCMYQTPERADRLFDLDLYACSHGEIMQASKVDLGLPDETWTGVGIRINDGLIRRVHIKTHGPVSYKTREFYPVWDWDNARLVSEIRKSGVKLPVDYKIWGRSFDGFDYRFLIGLKQHFPRDYAKVLEFFPLANLELLRYEKFAA